MKKSLLVLILFLLLTGWLSAQQMSLDNVIERSARSVEEVLQQGTKVAVLNFSSSSETFSDYVIEELTGKLVLGRKVTIVDHRNLALISQEMNLQLSGDVIDESAQAIGRMLGAQSIISGTLTNMGTFYRFRIRVINVETAAIQTQVSLDLQNDTQVAFLMGSNPTTTPPTSNNSILNDVITPLTEGTMVPGNSLTEKLAWLNRSADSHNTYILVATANENIAPHTFEYRGAINVTVVLRGDNQNRTIRLRTNGTMFTINSGVNFILENNITLHGHSGNNGAMVRLNGGNFRMNPGAAITGNIRIDNRNGGGGVRLEGGTFEMTGGVITNNTGTYGGGVCATIGTFIMTGGIISGNTATKGGGGVDVDGTFIMRGGTITGNTAREYGGGILVLPGTFTKSGGTITGYSSDHINGNVVKDEAGNVLARKGHAVYRNENLHKETTAGPEISLSINDGRWD